MRSVNSGKIKDQSKLIIQKGDAATVKRGTAMAGSPHRSGPQRAGVEGLAKRRN